MIFGVTTYLIGLLAIALPIAIHLWSKKTRKTIPFGTIRFLSEDDTQAIKSLIPTEWFLLLLRVMMLLVLVLIMSEPLWRVSEQKQELVLIDPAYKDHPNFKELTDSLLQNMDVRWFGEGFPMVEDSLRASGVSHWDLLTDLENGNSAITIISPRRLSRFVGIRPKVPRINWVSLPQDNSTVEIGDFISGSSGINILGVSDQQFTYFSHKESSGSSAEDSLVVTVAIQADDTFAELDKFIRASVEAINEDSPLQIRLTDEKEAEWLIWLKNDPTPIRRNLLYAIDHPNQEVICQISHGVFTIAEFQLESFLAYNFPIRLEQILGYGKVETIPYDLRELPENQLPQQSLNAGSGSFERMDDLSRWFWVMLLFILILERYLSLKTTTSE